MNGFVLRNKNKLCTKLLTHHLLYHFLVCLISIFLECSWKYDMSITYSDNDRKLNSLKGLFKQNFDAVLKAPANYRTQICRLYKLNLLLNLLVMQKVTPSHVILSGIQKYELSTNFFNIHSSFFSFHLLHLMLCSYFSSLISPPT